MRSINSLEEEIKPEDCLEMIEKKRYRELMEDELSRLLEIRAKVKVKAKSKHDNPQKRNKNSGPWSFSTTPSQTTCANHVLVVSHTDAEAIEKLKEIERS